MIEAIRPRQIGVGRWTALNDEGVDVGVLLAITTDSGEERFALPPPVARALVSALVDSLAILDGTDSP